MSILVLLLTLIGCQCQGGALPAGAREVTEVTTACLTKDGLVRVGFEGCLSSSCDELLRSSCDVKVENGAVVVTGSAVVQHVGDACTKDCKSVLATCEGELDAASVGLPINAKITPKLARCWDPTDQN